jgi:DNA-binding transcriptional ArsR family regulator
MDLSPDTHHDPSRAARLDAVFAALADPTRRAILAMLLEDDMAVTDVAEPFSMSLAAISKHLGVLVRAGLIRQDRRGRVTWCQLDPDALREASGWMLAFGQIDAIDLDGLERFLAVELESELVRTGEAGGCLPPGRGGAAPPPEDT